MKTGTPDWSYYAGLDEIYHAAWTARTLARIKVFKEALNHFWPEPAGHPVKLIQVAGTSGKGSTCKFLQSGLSEYGRAGCYVKPHVFDYAERFTVENGLATHEEILDVWDREIKPLSSEFALKGDGWVLGHREVSLLIALRIFQRHRLNWAAVETGMGGRYDPTTTLRVAATVLTNVGMDHEDVLGSEHWQRSLEKAGICRPGITLVLGDDDDRTLDVVTAVCRRVGTPLLRVSNGDVVELKRAFLRERQLRRGGPQTRDMFEGSSHQLRNAATALKTIRMLIDGAQLDRVVSRLARTEYVGRFSQVQEGVYADVAHNPSKMDALAEEIRSRFPRQMKKVFVVGISGNRNVVEVLRPITQQARVILVTAAGYKGRDPDEVCTVLRRAFPKLRVQSVSEPRATLKIANELRRPGEPVIYTGSTYMIDQALNPDDRLRHVNGTYGWREKSGKEWEEGELVVPDGFPPGKQPKRR